MKRDPLKQFVTLRNALIQRKQALESELLHINRALEIQAGAGSAAGKSAPVASVGAPASRKGPGRPARKARGKRARNEISLKDAVLAATKAKPLTKPEILKAIEKAGYKFSAKNPMNSLNTLLYSDKGFKNHGGKFGPA
jgi:hypothetical protein